MTWLEGAVGLMLAMLLQTTHEVRARWEWESPPTETDLAARWELEVDGAIRPCTPATITLRSGECGPVQIPPGTHTLRLRGVRASDGAAGPWSDAFKVGVGKAGPFEITPKQARPASPPAPPPPPEAAGRLPPLPPGPPGRLQPDPASLHFELRVDATELPPSLSTIVSAPEGLVWESHDSMPVIDISPQTECPFNGVDGVRCTGSATLVLTPSPAMLDLSAGSHRYRVRLSAAKRSDVTLQVTVTVAR
jgi:hypothetical protein